MLELAWHVLLLYTHSLTFYKIFFWGNEKIILYLFTSPVNILFASFSFNTTYPLLFCTLFVCFAVLHRLSIIFISKELIISFLTNMQQMWRGYRKNRSVILFVTNVTLNKVGETVFAGGGNRDIKKCFCGITC